MPMLTNETTLVSMTSPVQMSVNPTVEKVFVSTTAIPGETGTPQQEVSSLGEL